MNVSRAARNVTRSPRSRRTTLGLAALLGLAGLAGLAAVAQGCTLKTADDSSRFRGAVPVASDVALAVPKGSGGAAATTKSLHTKGGTPGTDAKYYQFTRDVADGVDVGTGWVLGLVDLIVQFPPTTVEPHRAVWGPGSGNALEPVVWRFTVTEVGSEEYDYVLAARPKASTTEADFKAILTGHGYGVAHPLHRKGTFTLDNDAYRALDPARGHDSGTIAVDFDLRTFPLTIHADAKKTDDGSNFDVTVTHQKDGGGAVDIAALGDIDVPKNGTLENVTLHSKWDLSGAGRADVDVTGGSLAPKTLDATECWSSSFLRVYYVDTLTTEPTMGDASACAFK